MAGNYEVMARRWRPRSFAEVVGQSHVVRTLCNAIGSNRVAHAYLFVGPRGTGKTSMARLLAMALNCPGGPSVDFNGEDATCTAIWRGEDLDVMEIDGASHNSVEEVRELRERCAYGPAAGRYRIFILDEVHMLSSAAFNALLKILEEPPTHVKFIFATTEIAKVPATILSRCQRFNFRPIGEEEIATHLSHIGKREGIAAEPAALAAIARLSDGSMRDAQTLFDQIITFHGNKLDENSVLEMHGLPSSAELGELTTILEEKDSERALAIAKDWDGRGIDLHRSLIDLQRILRRRLEEAAAEKSRRTALLELLRTLQDYGRHFPGVVSERATFAVALLEAIENSRRRPIGEILEALGR